MKTKHIAILATGGTIAGEASSKNSSTQYKAATLNIKSLLKDLTGLKDIARISAKQIANIDSCDIDEKLWLSLAKEVNKLVKDKDIDAVVITHGTDTMEETAYFLDLTIKSPKAVVLVGAMRPANAISSDGAKNLYNAICLASDESSKNKGVLALMNDKIYSARNISKIHTLNLDAFKEEIGYMLDEKPFFRYLNAKSIDEKFDLRNLYSLPRVDISYSYLGAKVAIKAFVKAGAKALVIAGSGAGSIDFDSKKYLIKLLKEKKIFVVKSSRVGSGLVSLSKEELEQGFISANDLNPQKARILLSLALTKTKDIKELRKIFDLY